MSAGNFDAALALVLKHEGGYVDHPKDPGGATNMGITIATLRAYRGRAVTKADVRNLTRAEAAAIYRKNYWDAIRGDDLPDGIDYCTFDFAVNSGPTRAAKALQREVGVEQDGAVGTLTLRAARVSDPREVIASMCDRRLAWLRSLDTWPTFGKGWASRIEGVRAGALRMVAAPAEAPALPLPAPRPDPVLVSGGIVAVIALLWDRVAAFLDWLF